MNEETKAAIEAGVAALASKATVAGAAATVWGWATSSQFIGLAGVSIAFLGLLINWYFRARGDKRDQEEHEERMRKLRRDSRPAPLSEADL